MLLGVLGAVFLVVNGLAYELDTLLEEDGIDPLCDTCPTIWHPPMGGLTLLIGTTIAGLVLGLSLSLGVAPESSRAAGAGMIVLSVAAIAFGDQFLVGGVLAILAGAAALGSASRP